ncbi:MAG: hypothetical protein ACTTIC_03540 [Helicobacteraceae bacterium]
MALFYESAKERQEKLKERLAVDVASILNEIAESPEKLTSEIALHIYNNHPKRRKQICAIFFAKLKTMEEWLEIYHMSGEKDDSKDLASQMLEKSSSTNKRWIELYQTEKDDFIKILSVKKVRENSKDLNDWIEVYKLCPYGFKLKDIALAKMREKSKTYEQWRDVYRISPFGSATNQIALEQIMLHAEPKDPNAAPTQPPPRRPVKTQQEWLKDYEQDGDLYSSSKDNALINSFVALNATTAKG